MSKSVEETRQELFYKWFDEQQSLAERCGLSLGNAEFDFAEAAFNAALDAVEIELPPQDISHYGGPDSEYGPSYEQVEGAGYNHGLSDCKLAIEATNLGLKIK